MRAFILPYGCRNGACGACKGGCVSGQVDCGTYPEGALTDAEAARGYALFCCARPLSDLTIECREVGAARDIQIKTLPCRVQKMARLAPDVMLLQLKLPANERLQFLAGQYIDILLKDGRRRSFSIANAPQDDDAWNCMCARCRAGISPTRFSNHEGDAISCASRARLALFSCARTASSRSSCSPAAPVLRRSSPSSSTPSTEIRRGR